MEGDALIERVDGTWIYFWRKPEEDKPKTQIWNVTSKEYNDWLGTISWFPRWRKYSFRSTAEHRGEHGRYLSDVWFEEDCLTEIANFCKELTRKTQRKDQGEGVK